MDVMKARIALLALATLVLLAHAPALIAAEGPHAPGYGFDVIVKPGVAKGELRLAILISSPDLASSTFMIDVKSVPDVRTISLTDRTTTQTVTINLAADGSAVASFKVTEGERVLAQETRTVEKPQPQVHAATNAIHLGDDPAITPPKLVTRVEPVYTAEAKEHRISGIVIVEATINESGAVEDVQILKPLPFGLDQAAADAVRQWRFEPAAKDGKPLRVNFNIVVKFVPPAEKTE